MSRVDLPRMLQEAYTEAGSIIDFGRGLWQASSLTGAKSAIHPRMHQIIRMHEAVRGGVKRMILEDATGSGKTYTAIGIFGLLAEEFRKTGRKAKALVIANDQARSSVWAEQAVNQYASSLGLPGLSCVEIERNNLDAIHNYDLMSLNFEKLSIDRGQGANAYFERIMRMLPDIDVVMVDEAHNLKNIASNRTRAFKEIVEGTRGKHFVVLTATAIPNRLRDAGFMLYMFDPVRYKHYADNPFDYSGDMFSIMNAMNSGAWFTLTREDVQALFSLPELSFGDASLGFGYPHRFEISHEDASKYFEEWKLHTPNFSKIPSLSRILLQSQFSELERMCVSIRHEEPEAQIAVYSFYVDGFSQELARNLGSIFPDQVGVITGQERSIEARLHTASLFREGQLRALINSTSTMGESISLATGERPVSVIVAEPIMVPGLRDQVIGRFLRPGQLAEVKFVENVPYSSHLNSLMVAEQEKQRNLGIRFRESWKPGNVFENKFEIRQDKVRAHDRVRHAQLLEDLADIAEVDEGSEDSRVYVSVPFAQEQGSSNMQFNESLRKVRSFIGRPIEELAGSADRLHLVEGYSRKDWEKTSSGDTNRAILETILELEQKAGRKLDILDVGCGTACLARVMKRQIHNLDLIPEMLRAGRAASVELGIYDEASANQFFHNADAKKMPFADASFDVVSSSYAVQYNAQGYKHHRDLEKILVQVNRVLRSDGHFILGLPNQVTGQEDLQNIAGVLFPRYGFVTLFSDYVTGHVMNEETDRENKVFAGFYLVVARKQAEYRSLVGEDDVFVYSPYKKLGIGGIREVCLSGRAHNGHKSSKLPASIFRSSDGKLLGEKLAVIK